MSTVRHFLGQRTTVDPPKLFDSRTPRVPLSTASDALFDPDH
jgi:hypothetical protein